MIRPQAVAYATSILALAAAMPLVAQSPNAVFNPLAPCRVVDSRINLGTPGTLLPGLIRDITFRGQCGIPGLTTDGGLESNVAVAIAVNVVAANAQGTGHLSAWPSNRPQPASSIINYSSASIANGVILPMCDREADPSSTGVCGGGDIKFQAAVSPTDLVIDVTGYYVKPTLSGAKRHGAGGVDSGVCVPSGSDTRYGLSDKLATFATAPLACPAGTQICSDLVVTAAACNTIRADSGCDFRTCDGTCVDLQPNNHFGWSNSASNPFQDRATAISENRVAIVVPTCEYYPVWCCSTPG